jgi:hypothetical protein
MYFKDFPKFLYDFKNPDGRTTSSTIVRDITRNVRFRRDLLANISVYDEYDVIDGETPEIIAEKVYGNPNYHWIVMLTNNYSDYRTDFPLDETSLVKHIERKYPNSVYGIHHYINADGFIVDSDTPGAVSISNDQYERDKNESKRRIKLVSKELIATILKNYKDIM